MLKRVRASWTDRIQLCRREHGIVVDRTRVTRLMGELGIRGISRRRKVFTTKSDPDAVRAPDLVNW